MEDPASKGTLGGPSRRRNIHPFMIIAFIIVIVIAYLIITAVINMLSVIGVNGPTTITLTNTSSVIANNGNEYALRLVSTASTSGATIAITRLPVFLNPTLFVTLVLNNVTNINTAGTLADLAITPTMISNTQVVMTITPVPSSLALAPTSYRITSVPAALPPIGASASITTTISASSTSAASSSTTVSSGGSSSSSASTTTISSSGGGSAEAQTLLQSDIYYGLMVNFTNIYAGTVNCNPALYNSTYQTKFGVAPSGPDSYATISNLVPYQLNLTITNSSSVYTAAYKTISHNATLTTGPALVVTLNVASKSITSSVLQGVFQGLNYTTLSASYHNIVKIGNACGVYVCSSSTYSCS